ncbi:hypothetical protein G7046_g1061 [Stylonectria norvegica]|nr:hypothetical protein G7046_g1061 [Stylonectria norvegica]
MVVQRTSASVGEVLDAESTIESFKHFVLGYDNLDDAWFSPRNRPYFLRLRSSRSFIVTAVILGIYVDIFLYGVSVVIIPFTLQEQIGIDYSGILAWNSYTLLAYSIGAIVMSPIAGIFADKTKSRRGPLVFGLVFLLSGTVCLWMASSGCILIIGRILQGVSCGVLWTIGLALIADMFPRDKVGGILAYADTSLHLGLASSPPIAGSMLKAVGIDGIYGLAMGLIGVDILMRLFLIEPTVAVKWSTESNLISEESQIRPVLDEENYAPEGAIIQVHVEEYDENEGVDAEGKKYWIILATSWRVIGALCGSFAVAHVLISVDATIPVYCQRRFGWGPREVGVLLLAFFFPSLLSAYTGRLADRHGGKWLAIAGFLGSVPTFVGLIFIDGLSDKDAKLTLWLLMTCAGISLSFVETPIMAEVIYAVKDKQDRYPVLQQNSGGYGLAYGMFMTIFSVGAATASIISPIILQHVGWRALMASLAICCIIGVIPVSIWTGDKSCKGRLGSRERRRMKKEALKEAREQHVVENIPEGAQD